MPDVRAHLAKAGIVHNDIKPDNFMVNENTGEPVLIDLGHASTSRARQVGYTPGYEAPKQCDQTEVDERTDVFGVGSMTVEAVEGFGNLNPNAMAGPAIMSNQGAYMGEEVWKRMYKDSVICIPATRSRRITSVR